MMEQTSSDIKVSIFGLIPLLMTTIHYIQVRERCRKEWTMFQTRLTNAEKAYYRELGIDPANITTH